MRFALAAVERCQRRADAVAGGDKQLAAKNQRRGGVHRRPALAEGKQLGDPAAGRIGQHAVHARDEDGLFLAAHFHRRRRGIAGGFVAGLPQGLAGRRIEGDDARAAAADIHQQLAARRESACCPRRNSLRRRRSRHRARATRAFLPSSRATACKIARRAEDIHVATRDQRHAARADVGIDAAAIAGRKIGLPERLAAGGIQAFDPLAGIDAMKHDDPLADDRRAGVAAAQLDIARAPSARSAGQDSASCSPSAWPLRFGPRICGQSPRARVLASENSDSSRHDEPRCRAHIGIPSMF